MTDKRIEPLAFMQDAMDRLVSDLKGAMLIHTEFRNASPEDSAQREYYQGQMDATELLLKHIGEYFSPPEPDWVPSLPVVFCPGCGQPMYHLPVDEPDEDGDYCVMFFCPDAACGWTSPLGRGKTPAEAVMNARLISCRRTRPGENGGDPFDVD